MKIVWVSGLSDCEFDLTNAIARSPDIELDYYCIIDPFDQNNDYHLAQLTEASNIDLIKVPVGFKNEMVKMLSKLSCDLMVFRHPMWVSSDSEASVFASFLKNQPLIVWTWEWEPNRHLNALCPLAWPRLAVTNHGDILRCMLEFPQKQCLYFPFGVINRNTNELQVNSDYQYDLMCDAQPHYVCGEYNNVKKNSVDILIKPVLGDNLALWGSRYGTITDCDWPASPELAPYHRGNFETKDYPKVYSSSKIYLGVSWNAYTGGYSIRFARALGCKMFIIWQDTYLHELDDPNQVVKYTNEPAETKELVNYYLSHDQERIDFAERANYWALQNWEWSIQLRRLSKEIR